MLLTLLGRDTKSIKFQVVLLLAKNSDAAKNVRVSFGTASILHYYENSVWGKVHFK